MACGFVGLYLFELRSFVYIEIGVDIPLENLPASVQVEFPPSLFRFCIFSFAVGLSLKMSLSIWFWYCCIPCFLVAQYEPWWRRNSSTMIEQRLRKKSACMMKSSASDIFTALIPFKRMWKIAWMSWKRDLKIRKIFVSKSMSIEFRFVLDKLVFSPIYFRVFIFFWKKIFCVQVVWIFSRIHLNLLSLHRGTMLVYFSWTILFSLSHPWTWALGGRIRFYFQCWWICVFA